MVSANCHMAVAKAECEIVPKSKKLICLDQTPLDLGLRPSVNRNNEICSKKFMDPTPFRILTPAWVVMALLV